MDVTGVTGDRMMNTKDLIQLLKDKYNTTIDGVDCVVFHRMYLVINTIRNEIKQELLDDEYSRGEIMNEWVSIKDKLPKCYDCSYIKDVIHNCSGDLLVVTKDKEITIAEYSEGDDSWYSEAHESIVDVTHWMYLPKLPVEKTTSISTNRLKGME